MKFLKLYLFTASFFLFGAFANAADYYWIGGSMAGNIWSDGLNWSLSSGGAPAVGIPQAGDNIIFDGAGAVDCGIDIDLTGINFNNVTIQNGYSNNFSFLVLSSFSCAQLTIEDGLVDFSNAQQVDVTSLFTINGGTYISVKSSPNNFNQLNMNGGFAYFDGGGAITVTTTTTVASGTLDLVGDGIFTFSGLVELSGGTVSINKSSDPVLFHSIEVSSASSVLTISNANVSVSNTIVISDGEINLDNAGTVTVSGSTTVSGGALNMLKSTSTTLQNVAISGGTLSGGAGGNLSLTGTLTITGGVINLDNAGIFAVTGATTFPSGAGSLTFSKSTSSSFGSFSIASASASFTASGGGAVTFGSTFGASAGTVNFNGAGNLTFTGAATINGGSVSLGTSGIAHTFSNNLNVSSGSFSGGSSPKINIAGTLAISSSGSFTSTSDSLVLGLGGTPFTFTGGTFTHNSGVVRMQLSSSNQSLPTGLTFSRLFIDASGSTAARSMTFGTSTNVTGSLIIGSRTGLNLNLQSGTVNISGNLDLTKHLGNATITSTIFNFNASSGTSTIIGNTTGTGLGRTGPINFNLTGTANLVLQNNITVNGNLVFNTANSVTTTGSTVAIVGSRNVDARGTGSVNLDFNNLQVGTTSATGSATLTGAIQVNGNLTIASSSTLNTSGSNHAVTLQGSFTNGGTFTPNNSVITLSGTNSQSLDFRNSTTPTLHTLTSTKSSGTATITDAVNISTLLQCTGGTLALGTDLVTLLSTSTTTAQVGNSAGGTYTGTVNIQRYIPSIGRRWRFLAAPVSSGATVANSWRNTMFITGPGTGTGPVALANYNSNGFDWISSGSPTIYTYNENQVVDFNSRWVALPSATTALNRGTGYRVFVRGDRSDVGRLNGSVTTQNEVTITANGGIPHGNLNVPITCSNGCGTDDGWNLIGNPYPATLDWNAFQTTNNTIISGVYTVLNPSSNAYETWNGTTGSAGQYISSGQAFWVKSSSASANLDFTESHKATSQSGGSKFKSGNLTNHLMITLSGTGFSNKAFVHQNTTGSYGADNYDALKFGYGSFQIATFEPGTNRKLDINNLPVYGAKTTDTIEVEVNVPATASNYQLSFSDVNTFNSNLKVYLQDKLLNTIQDLSTANTYSFATNGNAGSTGNRFRVLITNQTNPLPVVFTALEAQLNNNTTDLKWSTLSEKNNAKFVVERSVDMVTFNEIGLVKAVGNSNVRNNYTFADARPEAYTTNYYRIKQVDVNGKFSYSNIASITTDVKGNGINSSEEMNTIAKVFPVPTKDILNIEQLDGTTLSYSIVDVFGSEVLNGTTEITEAGSVIKVSALSNGIYFLIAKTDNGQSTKTRFIVE